MDSKSGSKDSPMQILLSEDAVKLVEKHLQLWSERNSALRRLELPKVYSEDIKVLDPLAQMNNLSEMNDFIDGLLRKFQSSKFTILKPIDSHNNIARLSWGFGPDNNPLQITGQDFFTFEDGKIKSLNIFLDA